MKKILLSPLVCEIMALIKYLNTGANMRKFLVFIVLTRRPMTFLYIKHKVAYKICYKSVKNFVISTSLKDNGA